jgi:16S rRNA processing protein RimM
MKRITAEELVQAGFIVKPYGFKGEVIIGAELTGYEDFPETDFIYLEMEGLPVPYLVTDRYIKNGQLIFQLEDVTTEQQAKTLNGASVFLHQDEVEFTDEDLSYEQLQGFRVFDKNAGDLGRIKGVDEYPMQLMARCNFRGKELLFPLNESIVISIDAKKRIVHTVLPEGLIDVYVTEE